MVAWDYLTVGWSRSQARFTRGFKGTLLFAFYLETLPPLNVMLRVRVALPPFASMSTKCLSFEDKPGLKKGPNILDISDLRPYSAPFQNL